MQEFLEYVVKGLVQHPDAVSVTPVERSGATVYELRLDSSDVGKIIGRQGRDDRSALRSLLLATAAREKRDPLLGGNRGRQAGRSG